MDKVNIWLLGLVMLLNVILAAALSVLAVSGPFRDDTQENTVRLLTQLGSDLQEDRKTLSQKEQIRLVSDFQLVAKTGAHAHAAGTKMIWTIVEVTVIALVLQIIVLVRIWRTRTAAMSAPPSGHSPSERRT